MDTGVFFYGFVITVLVALLLTVTGIVFGIGVARENRKRRAAAQRPWYDEVPRDGAQG